MRSYTEPISFNSNLITDIAGWTTTKVDSFTYPDRNVANYDIAYSDNTITTTAFFAGKRVIIEGIIARQGRELLDAQISELKRITYGINKSLVVPIEEEQRVFYETTLENISFSNIAGGYIEVILIFATSDPYNYSQTATTLLNELNETSGNVSYPVTFGGTADQLVTITYTVDSVTSATNKTVTFTNPATSTSIAVQRDWTATEVLVINNKDKTVTVDGDAVDYSGNFLEFASNAAYVNYTDDFTARQVDINITYNKRYF